MTRFSLVPSVFAFLVVVAFSGICVSQVATGIPPFGSTAGGPFDAVDLANLNVHFAVPIIHKAGRGLPFDYVMDYESSVWVPTVGGVWQPINSNWGWRAITEAKTGTVRIRSTQGSCWFTDGTGQRYKNHYPTTTYDGYSDPDGTFHTATIITTPGDGGLCDVPVPPVYTGTRSAFDGSGYTLIVNEEANPSIVVQGPSGLTINGPGSSTGNYADTNGNQLTTSVAGNVTTFTDTLGNTALTVNKSSSALTTYSYAVPSTGTAQITFN